MTAMQLCAELFRQMNPLLDSEVAMTKVIAFVKGLVIAQKRRNNGGLEMVNQFEVYWVDLNPTIGTEMQKIRTSSSVRSS